MLKMYMPWNDNLVMLKDEEPYSGHTPVILQFQQDTELDDIVDFVEYNCHKFHFIPPEDTYEILEKFSRRRLFTLILGKFE